MPQAERELKFYSADEGIAADGVGADADCRPVAVVSPKTPLQKLEAIAKAVPLLVGSGDPDVEGLAQDFAGWLADGAATSLDLTLGLRSQGGVSLRRALANADRDAQLRQLACEHAEWAGLDLSLIVRQMRDAFDRYETGRWLRDRASHMSPFGEPAATFCRLLRAGHRMPRTKQLRAILRREIQHPV